MTKVASKIDARVNDPDFIPKSPSTEGTLIEVKNAIKGLTGSGVDTTFTITSANTAYAIPASPPANFYTLIIYNASDTDIYFRFTTGVTAGMKIASGEKTIIDLGANQQVYVYCSSAGKVINLSYKEI
jgi:hypothetical protein